MWASLPLQPLKPWPPKAISTTKPPPRCHSMAVRNRRNTKEVGAFGEAVISAHKSNDAVKSKIKTKPPPSPPAAAAAEEEEEEKQESEQKPQQRQLRGADVLMALQRATAHKAKKNKEKGDAVIVPSARSRNDGARDNVKPLCIKPEWSVRLEELERSLDQLAHSHR